MKEKPKDWKLKTQPALFPGVSFATKRKKKKTFNAFQSCLHSPTVKPEAASQGRRVSVSAVLSSCSVLFAQKMQRRPMRFFFKPGVISGNPYMVNKWKIRRWKFWPDGGGRGKVDDKILMVRTKIITNALLDKVPWRRPRTPPPWWHHADCERQQAVIGRGVCHLSQSSHVKN